MITCLFCSSAADMTEEHIFGKWAAKILQVKYPIKVKINGTKPFEGSATRKTLKVSTNRVCKGCNTGWLAELEKSSQPLLKYIILGETKKVPEHFDPAEQHTIALWATKTMLLLDYASSYELHYRTSLFAQDKLELMMQNCSSTKAPLEGTKVWISATKTRNRTNPNADRLLSFHTSIRLSDGSYLSTFTLASLVIQILIKSAKSTEDINPPYPYRCLLTPIFPPLMRRIFFQPKKRLCVFEASDLEGLSLWSNNKHP